MKEWRPVLVKKILDSMFLITILMIGCISCTPNAASTTTLETEEKSLQIVTTIFPEYDWVREILGENPNHAELTMLMNSGSDLHNYQPTAEDILQISSCDLFIYVGGESDQWVQKVLDQSPNSQRQVIDLMDIMGDSLKEEELVEGMEEEQGHEEEEHEHEDGEYDEHVWLSLRNAQRFTTVISEALEQLDPTNAAQYAANTEAYNLKLAALDDQYQELADSATEKTILFGDRFPFRYLVDDYGLTYYAAFSGCSAESEASFDTILFLAQKVDELGLNTVFTLEKSNQKIAKTVIENTKEKNQSISTLNSMQSTTSEDVANGVTYLSIMDENYRTLQTVLK